MGHASDVGLLCLMRAMPEAYREGKGLTCALPGPPAAVESALDWARTWFARWWGIRALQRNRTIEDVYIIR